MSSSEASTNPEKTIAFFLKYLSMSDVMPHKPGWRIASSDAGVEYSVLGHFLDTGKLKEALRRLRFVPVETHPLIGESFHLKIEGGPAGGISVTLRELPGNFVTGTPVQVRSFHISD